MWISLLKNAQIQAENPIILIVAQKYSELWKDKALENF